MKLHSNIPFDDDSVNLQFPMFHAFKKATMDASFVNFKATIANGNGVVLVLADYNRSPSMFILTFHDGQFANPVKIVGTGSIEIVDKKQIKVNVTPWSNVSVISDTVIFE